MAKQTSEWAFEAAIEAVLLADGYDRVAPNTFDRQRAFFPAEALAYEREGGTPLKGVGTGAK